jgi:prepilin-type N-terminal cleavage/methylation domain-containing protein
VKRRAHPGRAGFTLAEVAVTLLIVSIGLVLVLQGLTTAKFSAAESHHRKVARELALLTLGQVEAGLFWEDLDGGGDVLTGSYAEEGYEDYHYELVLGDEEFRDEELDQRGEGYHDTWRYEREREDRAKDDADKDDDEEETVQPFEKVRIKVGYPQLRERPGSVVLERWMAWENVYGQEEDAEGTGTGTDVPPAEEPP